MAAHTKGRGLAINGEIGFGRFGDDLQRKEPHRSGPAVPTHSGLRTLSVDASRGLFNGLLAT